jgi:hypothetical protein
MKQSRVNQRLLGTPPQFGLPQNDPPGSALQGPSNIRLRWTRLQLQAFIVFNELEWL